MESCVAMSKSKMLQQAHESMDIVNRLWDCDYPNVIFCKIRQSKRSSKKVAQFFQAKADLERKFARELRKLATKSKDVIEEEEYVDHF